MRAFFADNMQIIIFISLIVITLVGYYIYSYRGFMKQRESFLELQNSLQINDEVVLSSGILGKIVRLDETVAVIESDKSRFKVNRYSINAKKS